MPPIPSDPWGDLHKIIDTTSAPDYRWTSNPSNPGVVTLHDDSGHQNYSFESLQDALNTTKRSNAFETPEAKRAMIEMFEAGLRQFKGSRPDPAGDLRRDEEEGELLGDTSDGGY
jgi:hypothetical protein